MEKNSKIDLENRLKQEAEDKDQIDFEEINKNNIIQKIKNLDLEDITPKDAWRILEEMKELV